MRVDSQPVDWFRVTGSAPQMAEKPGRGGGGFCVEGARPKPTSVNPPCQVRRDLAIVARYAPRFV